MISPGYGFTAIIVAFLGRLNPLGIVARRPRPGADLSRRRGGADRRSASPTRSARVFQGMLLFFVLACDTLILYRIRLVGVPSRKAAQGGRSECLKPSSSPSRPRRRRC